MSTLIITEKDKSARRIAEILSGGKFGSKKVLKLPVYVFKKNGQEVHVIGLKGHLLKVDFPSKYQNWQKVDPKELIDAEIIKIPIDKTVLKALKEEVARAEELIIATDFDREGELIGYDATEEAKKVKSFKALKRARFSALTPQEVNQAFRNLHKPFLSLALAGEARQEIDLVWGATLTRFLSLASRRFGKQFLSVGRVQSPTLCLLAQREKEIREFKPVDYWQLKLVLSKDGQQFVVVHEKERFFDQNEVEKIKNKLGEKGVVLDFEVSQKNVLPPSPFNTTQFLVAASSLARLSPARAMQVAEDLYMRGLISYPRVDNTVYPPSLNFKAVLGFLRKNQFYEEAVQAILSQKKIVPTRGKKQSTDHPPIYPTALPAADSLKGSEAKVYDLVARRFMATLSPSAQVEDSSVVVEVGGEKFIGKGFRVLKEGWYLAYPFSRRKDEPLPAMKKGDWVEVLEVKLEKKQTQPPQRYSSARLVQEMEKLGLGTKATRHQIIQNLYERNYIKGDPIQTTELGMAVAEALMQHMKPVSTPEMTSQLEDEMTEIAEEQKSKEEVVNHSRQLLKSVMKDLEGEKESLRKTVKAGIKAEGLIGKCSCGGELRIVVSRKSKKRFVGCSNYFNSDGKQKCSVSYPLPQKGVVVSTGQTCSFCGAPLVKIVNKGKKPWEICLNPECESKKEKEEKKQ